MECRDRRPESGEVIVEVQFRFRSITGSHPVEVPADELPLFWACGVTPQAVVAEAKPEFCITHAPGSMLVTDLKNSQLSVF